MKVKLTQLCLTWPQGGRPAGGHATCRFLDAAAAQGPRGCQGPFRPSGRNRALPLRRRRGQGSLEL